MASSVKNNFQTKKPTVGNLFEQLTQGGQRAEEIGMPRPPPSQNRGPLLEAQSARRPMTVSATATALTSSTGVAAQTGMMAAGTKGTATRSASATARPSRHTASSSSDMVGMDRDSLAQQRYALIGVGMPTTTSINDTKPTVTSLGGGARSTSSNHNSRLGGESGLRPPPATGVTNRALAAHPFPSASQPPPTSSTLSMFITPRLGGQQSLTAISSTSSAFLPPLISSGSHQDNKRPFLQTGDYGGSMEEGLSTTPPFTTPTNTPRAAERAKAGVKMVLGLGTPKKSPVPLPLHHAGEKYRGGNAPAAEESSRRVVVDDAIANDKAGDDKEASSALRRRATRSGGREAADHHDGYKSVAIQPQPPSSRPPTGRLTSQAARNTTTTPTEHEPLTPSLAEGGVAAEMNDVRKAHPSRSSSSVAAVSGAPCSEATAMSNDNTAVSVSRARSDSKRGAPTPTLFPPTVAAVYNPSSPQRARDQATALLRHGYGKNRGAGGGRSGSIIMGSTTQPPFVVSIDENKTNNNKAPSAANKKPTSSGTAVSTGSIKRGGVSSGFGFASGGGGSNGAGGGGGHSLPSPTIVSLVASFDTTYYAKRTAAAICIQCAWRSSKARLEAYSRRQIFLHFVYIRQKAAVTCIVSFMKAILLKKRRLTLKRRNDERVAAKIEIERAQRAAVIRITNAIRRYMAKKKETARLMRLLRLREEERLSCYRLSAVIIQRWWRIIRVEKAYWRRRAAEIASEKAKRAEEERIEGAATQIQKIFRGALGRRHAITRKEEAKREKAAAVRRIKESIDVVRVFLQSVAVRKRREVSTGERLIVSDDGATVTKVPISLSASIDHGTNSGRASGVSGNMADKVALRIAEQQRERAEQKRRELDSMAAQQMIRSAQHMVYQRAMEVARACGRIQRTWRRYKARRELRVKRTIARTHDLIRIDREYDQYKGICVLQRFIFAFISTRHVRRVEAYTTKQVSAALRVLQSVCKGYCSRLRLRHEQCVAIYTANSVVYEAARRYNRNCNVLVAYLLGRASLLERAQRQAKKEREDKALMVEVMRLVEEDKAAKRIQRLMKSTLVRRETQRQVLELRAAKERVLLAVIKIQSFIRAKVLARKAYREAKRKRDFANRNRALEIELFERELLSFVMRFEEIEGMSRYEIEAEEAEEAGRMLTTFT